MTAPCGMSIRTHFTSMASTCQITPQSLTLILETSLTLSQRHVSISTAYKFIPLPYGLSFKRRHRIRERRQRFAGEGKGIVQGKKMSAAELQLQLPPGFRFHPTDDELVMHYLCRKCASQSIAVPIIAELDLYKHDPWDLPDLALYGEKEWYFFSPRDRKYPNGSRPNRAAGSGYWKATGADKPIGQPKPVGIKKALVFYSGKAPKGEKTNWIMHEYRLADVDRSVRKKNSLRLDDWVLCRIYNKKGYIEKQPPPQRSVTKEASATEMEDKKPDIVTFGKVTCGLPPTDTARGSDFVYFDSSESVPRVHTESSCSEHVVLPEFPAEVQSMPKWKEELGSTTNNNVLDSLYNYMDATRDIGFASQMQGNNNQLSPLQDIFMYLQKPF